MAKAPSRERIRDYDTRLWRHAREYYRPWNDLYGRLIAYCLDLQHYKRDFQFDNDISRIQPKGQRLFNLIRHKIALLTTRPLTFDCHPVQPNADALAAHLSAQVLKATVFNPSFRYGTNRRKLVASALAGARGCMASEYDPDVPGGSCIRLVDPRRLFACPGVLDFHDARAPYCIEEVPMHLSAVRAKKYTAGWDVPDDLMPDNWKSDYTQGNQSTDTTAAFSDNGELLPSVDEAMAGDGIVTVLKIHYRHDPWAATEDRARRYDLPREDWYWGSDATGEKVPVPVSVDPARVPAPMDQAGQPMLLHTTRGDMEEHYMYPEGTCHITFPHYRGNKSAGFRGDWLPGKVNQDVRMTNFPYMHLTAYPHPLRLIGKSDTEILNSLQMIDNGSFRAAWEQMRAAQLLIISMRGGLEGADPGMPFTFSDSPVQLAYATDRLAADAIKFVQAQGMNPAMGAFRQFISDEWSLIGSGDIPMPDNRSRDVAVGTMQAMQQMGDMPVRMHAEDLSGEESIFLRVILDQKRAYMSVPEMVSWVNEDAGLVGPDGAPIPLGAQMAQGVTGDMLAASNVIVTTQADWRSMDIDRVQAISQFMGQVPPPMWGVLAPEAGFSPDVVLQLKAAAAQMMPPAGGPNPLSPKSGAGQPQGSGAPTR